MMMRRLRIDRGALVNGWRLMIVGVLSVMLISLLLFHGCVKKQETADYSVNEVANNTNQQETPVQDLNQDLQQAAQDDVNLTDLDNANIDTSLFE